MDAAIRLQSSRSRLTCAGGDGGAMIKTMVCVMAAALGAGAAGAADKLVMAPAASWVAPVPMPPTSKPDGAAAHVILQDQQIDLQPGR